MNRERLYMLCEFLVLYLFHTHAFYVETIANKASAAELVNVPMLRAHVSITLATRRKALAAFITKMATTFAGDVSTAVTTLHLETLNIQ